MGDRKMNRERSYFSVRHFSVDRGQNHDEIIRFESISFQKPAQTLFLPVSIEFVRVIKGSTVPVWRSVSTFTNYKRFVTDVRLSVPN